MATKSTIQSNDKPVGRQILYQMASRHAHSAISHLVELLDSTNENVALGAARTLLDKTLPSVKSVELQSPELNEIKVVIKDYTRTIEDTLERKNGSKSEVIAEK